MVAARRSRGSGSEWSQQRHRAGRSRESSAVLSTRKALQSSGGDAVPSPASSRLRLGFCRSVRDGATRLASDKGVAPLREALAGKLQTRRRKREGTKRNEKSKERL